MATGTAISRESNEANFRAHVGSISRQSSIYFAGTIFAAGIGYLFKVYLARILGAEALGIYALGMTIIAFAALFNTFGLPQAAVRFVAVYSANQQAGLLRGFILRSMTLILIANIVCVVVVLQVGPWIGLHFYHTAGLPPLMKWLGLIMVCSALNGFLGQALAGFKQVARRTVLTTFIGTPLTIGITVLLLSADMGLQGYVIAQAISGICILLLLAIAVWRATPRLLPGDTSLALPLQNDVWNFSAALFGVGLLEFTLGQADAIMVGHFRKPDDVGVYAVAMAIVGAVPLLLQSTNQIFSPMIAHLHTRGELILMGRIFQTITKWILGFTLPLVLAVTMFAHPIMRIYGPEFEAGAVILIIGALGQLINCAAGPVGYLLLMSGNQNVLIRIELVMAVLVLILNRMLIPHWGLMGAALAVAITTVGTNIWCLYEVRRKLGLWPYNRSYTRLVLPLTVAFATMAMVKIRLSFVRPEWLEIVAALLGGYGVFTLVALAFGLDQDDRMIVKAVKERLGWRNQPAGELA